MARLWRRIPRTGDKRKMTEKVIPLEELGKMGTVKVYNQAYVDKLEKEKCELLGIIQGKDEVIKDLEWQIKQIIEDNEGNIINIAKKVKQTYKDGAEFGYNKANEWHYVKELNDRGKNENRKPNFLYLKHDMVDAIAYAIYYTANPKSEMCIPNCAYIQAEKMFEKWKEIKEND